MSRIIAVLGVIALAGGLNACQQQGTATPRDISGTWNFDVVDDPQCDGEADPYSVPGTMTD